MLGDLDAAEETVQEALAAALVHWPVDGLPDNPGAWLMTVARRKLIDGARRRLTAETASGDLQVLSDGFAAERRLKNSPTSKSSRSTRRAR